MQHKPAALKQSLPLRQARQKGAWPEVHDRLWSELRARHGDSEGTRQMVEALMLLRDHPRAEVLMGMALALQ